MPVMTDEGAQAPENPEAADKLDNKDDAVIDKVMVEAILADDETETVTDEEVIAGEEAIAASEAVTASRPGFLLPAMIGALVAALAGAGFFGWQFWQQSQLDTARESAQRAAVSYAQVLTSVDSNNVDENFKQVLDGATGEFKDMYSKSSVELRQLLIENKATAHGVVVDSAVQSASKDKAVVLLFVDQSVANTKLPDPRIDRSRMKMTLEKVDGGWKASKIELP